MAIAFDATTGPLAYFANATSLTRSLTVSGTDRLLIVYVVGGASDPSGISGVTYNGVSMTFLASVRQGTGLRSDLYYLVAPDTGANNIVVSRSSSGVIVLGAASYTGVDQTTPLPNNNTGGGSSTTSYSASLTTTETNSWIVVGARDESGRNLTESGWLERVQNESNGYGTHYGDTNGTVSVGANTLTGTFNATTTYGYIIAEMAEKATAAGFAYSQAVVIA